jgi:hypothetical protein
MLAQQTEDLKRLRRELETERMRLQESHVANSRKMAAEREAWNKTRLAQEKVLAEREQRLDTREESLGQLRVELENTQREVLEMRLATEETWAQLAGSLAPAVLTRSLAQTRAKLADHYQISLGELESKQHEMQQVRDELASQHAELSRHRQQLRDWAIRREEDLQQQAIKLVGREQELNRQQQYYEKLEESWALERDNLKARIRELLADLRTDTLRRAA